MEKNKEIKPIHNIKDDIRDILISLNKLQKDFHELSEINKDMKNLIAEYLIKPEKPKGWFFN